MVNAVNNYIDSLEKEITVHLKGVSRLDEDPVHDFRVCLKKLRTVLGFLDYWSYRSISQYQLYSGLRPIFKKTGKIRELQVHISLLPDLTEKSGLELEFLSKKILYPIKRNQPYVARDVKIFKKNQPALFNTIREQIEFAAKHRTRVDAATKFQKRLELRIQKQLNTPEPNLHRIRRLFKQKVYVFDTFQESELLSFYQTFRSEWKILESTMGKWHDQVMFMEYLIKSLHWKRLSDEQYKTMMKLIAHLRGSTSNMEDQLLQSIPRLPD